MTGEPIRIDPRLRYFAYGSNLDSLQMRDCCPGHRTIGPALLSDHALRFRGHSEHWEGAVATIDPQPGETVWGVLFVLTESDRDRLDRYEHFLGHGRADNFYDRTWVTVMGPGGETVRAEAYVMRPFPEGYPSRRYRDLIARGARSHGLPPEYVAWLRGFPTVD